MAGILNIWDPAKKDYVPMPVFMGPPGVSIRSIERTDGDGSQGSVDTYTITMTDGETFQFAVYNGRDGARGEDGGGAVTKESVEAVLTGDITTHSHSQYVSQNQNVLASKVIAQNDEDYDTMRVRNIAIVSKTATEVPAGGFGDIYFTYG